jgi:hypothetical protein
VIDSITLSSLPTSGASNWFHVAVHPEVGAGADGFTPAVAGSAAQRTTGIAAAARTIAA